jgi:hypothetical protein
MSNAGAGGAVRALVRLAVLPLGAMALACSDGEKERASNELSADLAKDLQMASAASVELASGAQGYERMRVVSAIEAAPAGTRPTPTAKAPKPKKANPPRPVRKRTPKPTPAAAPVEAGETAVAVAPQTSDGAPTEAGVAAEPDGAEQAPANEPTEGAGNDPAPEPLPAPRPTPVPVSYPGPERYPEGGGDGVGTVIGTVIGVVIRGGGAGIDHCDERAVRRRRGRGGGIAIGGVGIPVGGVGIPVMRPTFPAPYPRY